MSSGRYWLQSRETPNFAHLLARPLPDQAQPSIAMNPVLVLWRRGAGSELRPLTDVPKRNDATLIGASHRIRLRWQPTRTLAVVIREVPNLLKG